MNGDVYAPAAPVFGQQLSCPLDRRYVGPNVVFPGNLMSVILPAVGSSTTERAYSVYNRHDQSRMVMCVTPHISYRELLGEF
jgi:hypothetical protein